MQITNHQAKYYARSQVLEYVRYTKRQAVTQPLVLTQTAEEAGETRGLKLRQIEPEFLERMFAEEEI